MRIQDAIYGIPGLQWLSENSYFYSLFFNKIWEFFKVRLAVIAEAQTAGKGETGVAATKAFEYAVPTGTKFSGYEIALTAALIERMHHFCKERGIRFIVADIPVRVGPYRYKSSVPQALLDRMMASRVEYISSASLLEKYDGAAEMHVPNGHQHISEFTHTLIGVEIGRHLIKSGADTVTK